MEAAWKINRSTLKQWRDFVDKHKNNDFVIKRERKNIKRKDIDLSRQNIWRTLVGCQVTTVQRSGPNSNVSRFLKSSSSALNHITCKKSPCIEKMIEIECSAAGLRRGTTIAKNLASIIENLEAGEWKVLQEHLSTLETYPTQKKERTVVHYLQSGAFPGLGPKQSRNFIQWLGLSRYEIPLDSRVLKHLRKFGCSYVPKGAALSDENVYIFMQDGLQQVAKLLGIFPCLLDACIFSSFDNEPYIEEEGEDHLT